MWSFLLFTHLGISVLLLTFVLTCIAALPCSQEGVCLGMGTSCCAAKLAALTLLTWQLWMVFLHSVVHLCIFSYWSTVWWKRALDPNCLCRLSADTGCSGHHREFLYPLPHWVPMNNHHRTGSNVIHILLVPLHLTQNYWFLYLGVLGVLCRQIWMCCTCLYSLWVRVRK